MADETTNELPPEAGSRTFEQAMQLWVQPEIDRRDQLGLLPADFELTAAQIIMRPDEPLEVRLNAEIRAVARMKMPIDVKKGDRVDLAAVESIKSIVLTDADPDAAHLTMIRLPRGWSLAFDFRYNATKSRRVFDMAAEFLEAAALSMLAGRSRAAADNLFSAVELMAWVELMLLPIEPRPKKGRFTHGWVSMVYNKRAKANLTSASAASAYALNRLSKLRVNARYRPEHFDARELPKLVIAARQKAAFLRESLPERASVDPELIAAKPKPPPQLCIRQLPPGDEGFP